jgi:hypothetical protein
MKRFFFGFLWFWIFLLGELVLMALIVGLPVAIPAAQTAQQQHMNPSDGFAFVGNAGHSAGYEFGQKYSFVFWAGALFLAVGGSVLGILPGTKPRRADPKDT